MTFEKGKVLLKFRDYIFKVDSVDSEQIEGDKVKTTITTTQISERGKIVGWIVHTEEKYDSGNDNSGWEFYTDWKDDAWYGGTRFDMLTRMAVMWDIYCRRDHGRY